MTSYSEALKNVQDTIATADSLRGLFSQIRSDVKEYLEWKTRLDGLLQDLGEWAPMVYRPGGQWWLPVLRAPPFEEYLSDHNGVVSPAPDCQARVGWAKLLHALGLRPTDTKTLDWKSTRSTSFDPTAPDAIRLEMEGRVLCHMVNLFKIYDEDTNARAVHRGGKRGRPAATLELQFGRLTIAEPAMMEEIVDLTFEEVSHRALHKRTAPFKVHAMHADLCGEFDAGTAYASYELALRYGISATKAALSVSNDYHQRARKDRAADLLASMGFIEQLKGQPVLITKRWIEDVCRIWRRVTVNPGENGDEDTRLVDLLVQGMSSPEIMARIRKESGAEDRFIIGAINKDIKLCCMVNGDLAIYWTLRSKSKTSLDECMPWILEEQLPSLLAGVKGAWAGSWNRELGEMVDEGTLERLLNLPHTLANKGILIMMYAEGHELWDANPRCYVG